MRPRTNNMFKTKQSIFSISIVIGLVVAFAFPAVLHAQADDFAFERFESEIQIRVNGQMDMTETIEVNFETPRRGIYRVIPLEYQTEDEGMVRRIEITNVFVTDEADRPLTTHIESTDLTNIRVGDPEIYLTGTQIYKIHYTVSGALNAFETTDAMYWDITGTEWSAVPKTVSALVRLPEPVDPANLTSACYTGTYGSTEQNCVVEEQTDGTVSFTTQNNFLTVAVEFPEGLVTVAEPVLVSSDSIAPG